MHTLTKADLAATIITLHDLEKNQAKKLVEDFFEVICDCLENGENVKISGLGRFVLLKKRERVARNPKTGDRAMVSARTVVSFRPSVTLKNKFDTLAELANRQFSSSQFEGNRDRAQ